MLRMLRDVIQKAIGLNRVQEQIRGDLAEIRSMLMRIDGALKVTQETDSSLILSDLDQLFQKRLDEKLNFYFRWRLPYSFPENGKTFIHTNDGHRLYADPNEPFVTLHLLEHGEWETAVRRELRRELAAGSTFIDIGANIGLHTLLATALVGDKGKVIALEPHPITMELLRQNLEINGMLDRVTLAQLALADEDDTIVSFEYFAEHPAMSGLKVSQEVIDKFKGTLQKIDVKTITLDTLVERMGLTPDLVKIDVEGFEYTVLQGCIKTIEKFHDVRFLMEYEKAMAESVVRPGVGGEISKFFKARGFKISRVDENQLSPITHEQFLVEVRGDYIFSR